MKQEIITKIIGDEYDEVLIRNLGIVLEKNNITFSKKDWGLAGSQEFQVFEILYKEEPLKIEIETYIGVSLIGSENIINDITTQIKQLGSISN